MGCSPSSNLPNHSGKEPLSCATVLTENQNAKYQHRVTSLDSPDGVTSLHNSKHNQNNNNRKLDTDNNNTPEKKSQNQVHWKDSKHYNEGTDSEKIIPVITSEGRTDHLNNNSPLHMLTRHYNNSGTQSDAELTNGRKSVLKTSSNGIRHDHMLSNRKSVKFLDSVTVITVF